MILIKPKFKYILLVPKEQQRFNEKNYKSHSQTLDSIECFADSYKTNEDGSITFYQIIKTDTDFVRIPVMSYSSGKWHSCILIDANDNYPVFTPSNVSMQVTKTSKQVNKIVDNGNNNNSNTIDENKENIIKDTNYSNSNFDSFTDLDDLINDNNNDNNTKNITTNSNSNNNNSSNNNLLNSSLNYNYAQSSQTNKIDITTIGMGQDFKKVKNDFIEKMALIYIKENDSFNIQKFIKYTTRFNENEIKIEDEDVMWIISSLLKRKMVSTQKFIIKEHQRLLDLHLPSILKRHGDSKMSPLLSMLQDKDETKLITQIDLAVWLANR